MSLCPRDSVGLICRNSKGEFLMLERLKYPPGLACVAGHLDIIDGQKEDFLHGAVREWHEETGSVARNVRFLFEGQFPHPCGQYDSHFWKVYEVLVYEGEPRLMEEKKHGFVKWFSVEEITDWLKAGKPVDPAWFGFIFPKLVEIGRVEYRNLLP